MVSVCLVTAQTIMIGEKAAEMIARDHGVKLNEFVGGANVARASRP
jgi:hypothetical protein